MNRLTGLRLIVCFALAGLVVTAILGSPRASSTAAPAPRGISDATMRWSACTTGQRFVAERLKAPSQARFEDCLGPLQLTHAGDRWVLTSWVDAPNSFGAKLRTPFTIAMSPTIAGTSITWSLIGLDLE